MKFLHSYENVSATWGVFPHMPHSLTQKLTESGGQGLAAQSEISWLVPCLAK
jgi:hypothetical protein